MITKTFEVRDKGTFIPVLAVSMETDNETDRFIIGRGGFGKSVQEQAKYVILINLVNFISTYDHYNWNSETLTVAHAHIIQHFHDMNTGDVIDVEYIMGLSETQKISERI